jgi:hypothetical protein
LVIAGRRGGAAFDRSGNKVKEFSGRGGNDWHIGNFLQAVRSRRLQELNADIEEGHISSALCHLANISYRLGETVPVEEAISRWMNCGVSDNAKQMLERSILQLAAADPHVSRTGMAMGVELVCDPASETLPGNEQASQMLTRSYRKPFVVPCAGNV